MGNPNHPAKDSKIKVGPIKSLEEIAKIKRQLKDNPRNLALFAVGIHTNLRASDIVQLTVGKVRDLKEGDKLDLVEKKTSKARTINANAIVVETIQALLATMPEAKDNDPLFRSAKTGASITEISLHKLVKSWCTKAKLKGNYGSHTLRKTFGYIHRTVNKTDLPTLMHMFNHSSQKQTLEYLCIQPEEVKDAYMFEMW